MLSETAQRRALAPELQELDINCSVATHVSRSQARQLAAQSIEGAIVRALLPETIRKDHGFEPEPELVGRWQGAVHTFSGHVLMELDLKENGSVFARIGNGPNQEVMNVRFDPKDSLLLLDGVEGDDATPDAARHPYQLRYSLKQRAPDILNGTVSAVSLVTKPDRMGSALSHWDELRKQTAGR